MVESGIHDVFITNQIIGWNKILRLARLAHHSNLTLLVDDVGNVNQLAKQLGHDYSTIKHHLDVLMENKLVEPAGGKYGQLYFLSTALQESYGQFIEMLGKFGKKQT
jgi:DNA-binding transcriptional ArsR family regulator